ncbi:glutathione S-transferase [Chachezhania sediminis]|uniref:glutathione S-transferase n=1 Tax=Chachezhania sediminis TaxID=2599291 RepID=UPI00131DA153|nr:glutathione S-transferase [Chachezhania sediminis]
MKLYYSPSSPFVRKVLVVAHETGQADDLALVEISTTSIAPSEELRAQNPLAKLPALARDDGPAIYDSRVICAFLDDRAGAGLYGTGPAQWEMRTLEATCDGILDAAVLMVYESRVRPEDKRFDGWVEAQWGKVVSGLKGIEDRWMGHLSGKLNIGQIGLGCALGYLDLRHGPRDWRQHVPALAAWYETFGARPSMEATKPPAA